jgi:hypothetical protein
MRPSHSIVRTLLKASRIAVPCLVCLGTTAVASADQFQILRPQRRQATLCDPRMASLRKVIGAQRMVGPLANRHKRIQGGLTDATARLKRASHTKLGDDAVAIQNDAPAASIELDEGATSPLRALGVLGSSFDRLPRTTPFSPRPPRGPPSVT